MVRSNPKKQKGDDAFTTRKQKVGRKKLAPVTTTRAEVHARTLHIATSTAMAKATAAAAGGDEDPTAFGRGTASSRQANSKSIQVLSYSELLAGAHHYKAANRSSALTTMSRLLAMQEDRDLKEMAAGNAFSGFLTLPTPHRLGSSNSGNSPKDGLTGVSPLEKLKSFAAALDAMTDTDDDARKAALQCLKIILRHQWLSSSQTAHTTKGTTAVQSMIARETNDSVFLSMMTGSVVEREHTRAVLQAVHVSLTHALKSVRTSGVELLGLLLTYAPAGAVRRASREVCLQQKSYLHTVTSTFDCTSHRGDDQSLSAMEEEAWMLKLVERVSALVMKTPHMWVLPELLAALLMDDSSSRATSGMISSATPDWRHPVLVSKFFDDVLPLWSNAWKEMQEMRLALFRHDDKLLNAIALGKSFAVVLTFLKQKQMQASGGMLSATAEDTLKASHSAAFIPRTKQQLIKNLFINRVPVTVEEILSNGSPNRLEFALVLAEVCIPLAGSDDGWRFLHHYYHGLFSRKGSDNSTVSPSPPLSTAALLQCLQSFLVALHMYPRRVHCRDQHDGLGVIMTDRPSSSTNNNNVTEKLLTFVPGILHSVTQHLSVHVAAAAAAASVAGGSTGRVADANKSHVAAEALLMQVLLAELIYMNPYICICICLYICPIKGNPTLLLFFI